MSGVCFLVVKLQAFRKCVCLMYFLFTSVEIVVGTSDTVVIAAAATASAVNFGIVFPTEN